MTLTPEKIKKSFDDFLEEYERILGFKFFAAPVYKREQALEERDKFQAQLSKALKGKEAQLEEAKREERERILNQMALERCDHDVMASFEDYYWLPKSIWQALRGE